MEKYTLQSKWRAVHPFVSFSTVTDIYTASLVHQLNISNNKTYNVYKFDRQPHTHTHTYAITGNHVCSLKRIELYTTDFGSAARRLRVFFSLLSTDFRSCFYLLAFFRIFFSLYRRLQLVGMVCWTSIEPNLYWILVMTARWKKYTPNLNKSFSFFLLFLRFLLFYFCFSHTASPNVASQRKKQHWKIIRKVCSTCFFFFVIGIVAAPDWMFL